MASSRELLDALRAARADETVASVLSSPSPAWKNMNQSPPRALMRDQVDTREAAGVKKWLAFHQQQLQLSEKRRVGNRLRAQEAFEQSQAELEALQQELERSRPLAQELATSRGVGRGGGTPSPPSRPESARQSVTRQKSPLRAQSNRPNRGDKNGGRDTPTRSAAIVVSPQQSQSIAEVRNVNLLKQAVAERDTIIERLQSKLASDRAFYQAQLARLREDLEAAHADANARVTGLRSQLEASLMGNRSMLSPARDAVAAGWDAAGEPLLTKGEQLVMEAKIVELQSLFSEATNVLKEQTKTNVGFHTEQVERRIEELRSAADLAINAAKEVFRADRITASNFAKEELLATLTRQQNETVADAADSLAKDLAGQVAEHAKDFIKSAVRAEFEASGTISKLQQFLENEVKGRVTLSMEGELSALVERHVAHFTAALSKHIEDAKLEVSYVAASYAGIDARGIDHVLNSTQSEFKALRHAAEKAAHKHELEHLAFMAKARHVLDRIGVAHRVKERYADAAAVEL